MVPYCLPTSKMNLVCSCLIIFDTNASVTNIKKHINNCYGSNYLRDPQKNKRHESIPKLDIGGDEFNNLVKRPQFFCCEGKLCLRIQKNIPIIGCVCGHTSAYYKITDHYKTCAYLESILNPKKKKGANQVNSELNIGDPLIVEYQSVNNTTTKEKRIPIVDKTANDDKNSYKYSLMFDKSFNKYSPFANDSV